MSSVIGDLVVGRRNQSIVIRGSHLWRNPTVYVGGTAATQVEVHPDMGGLVATFAALPTPHDDSQKPRTLPLSVATSHGSAASATGVYMYHEQRLQPFVTALAPRWIDGSGTVRLTYDADAMPASWHRLILTLRPQGEASWLTIDKLPVFDAQRQQFSYEIGRVGPLASWSNKGTARYDVGLMMQASPFEDATRVRAANGSAVLGTMIVVPNGRKASATLSAKGLRLDAQGNATSDLVATMSVLVAEVHAAVRGKSVTVRFRYAKDRSKDVTLTKTWPAGSSRLTLTRADLGNKFAAFAAGTKLSVEIGYERKVLPVAGTLELTR